MPEKFKALHVAREVAEASLPDLEAALSNVRKRRESTPPATLIEAFRLDQEREEAAQHLEVMEAHLRCALKGLPALLTAKVPTWYMNWVLSGASEIADQKAVISTRQVICALGAVRASVPESIKAQEDGSVEIVWPGVRQHTWVIVASELSWPGCNVRTYARSSPDSPALTKRRFGLAHRLIEYALQNLAESW